jgi:hypothetical protein
VPVDRKAKTLATKTKHKATIEALEGDAPTKAGAAAKAKAKAAPAKKPAAKRPKQR